ncbi:MAG TPA: VWA domain-containing protein [Candidatus Omnitrophota bacterium]|nr:VWA domain-containing protein [Candidatus Omnitrophota bacterium]HPS21098.1 VWA domain-containing protein [Candidatus Omnitrophota bacterium]
MMRFADPWYLLLVLLIPGVIFLSKKFENKLIPSLRFSDAFLVRHLKPSLRSRLCGKMIYLRGVALVFFVLALARPQTPIEETKVFVEGIDIVLAIDCSGSMQALDFEIGGQRTDRLTVVKQVVEGFVKKRPNDRIGIVAFSAQAYSVCPLTLDHDWLLKNLERVKIGLIEDGTAIGSGLGASINRLKDTEAKSKIVILLTDGRNNAGRISPISAAEVARAIGVKVYTIGAGTKGLVPFPMKDMYGNTVVQPVEISVDEDLLKKMAKITEGRYYWASDTESLKKIYDDIDRLEKTKIEEVGYNRYNEFFWIFLFPALGLLLLEIVLTNTALRRIP